jgi:hypothetical protein
MLVRAGMRAAAARAFAAVCLLVAVFALSACGGDAEPAAAPAEEPPPATTEPPATTAEPPATTEAPPATTEEPRATTAEEPPPPEEEPTPLPGEGLPKDILGYQDWPKLNEQPIPPIEGGDAHLGTKDVFASQEADRSGGELVYPDGTIIVKEARRPDADFIGLVAIMRKEAGADPEHGDWVFIEYARESPDAAFGELAADAVCWGCHSGAQATDWVWVHTTGAAPSG